MPVFLERGEDSLEVKINGYKSKADFQDVLARVKSNPGATWDPEKKVWRFPDLPETALRLVTSTGALPSAELEHELKAAAAEVAGQLLTNVGDDADDLAYAQSDALFPYQRAAVHFMRTNPKLILADEMGLGKTVESIAGVEEWIAANPDTTQGEPQEILIICPKAMRGTWADEAEKWGDWTAQIVNGSTPTKRLEQLEEKGHPDDWSKHRCWIINWESFWRDPVLPALRKRNWVAIIADEAHRAKNHKSKQAQGLHKLHAPVQIAATGTPIMNTPTELWSLLHWLDKDQWSSFWRFRNMYADEIEASGYNRRILVGVKNADALRFEIKDRLVRRRKKDVLKDLPDKLPNQIIDVKLTPAQRKFYEDAQTALFLDIAVHIREHGGDPEEFASMPLNKLIAMVPNTGARIAKLRQITAGAKVPVAVELIREEPDVPVVAFTWHVEIARQLAAQLSDGPHGQRVGTIAGTDDADPVKVAFQAGELDHVVCTIAKGGAGLTLTRSSNPILVEEDWVPANNDQAIDRTHRVGQHDTVTPRVLRCVGTVDDGRIAPRNEFKRAITAQILGE